MSFILIKFGDAELPRSQGEAEQSVQSVDGMFELPGGGVFDYYQNYDAPLKKQSIISDGFVVGNNHEDMIRKVNQLRSLVGSKAYLKRKINMLGILSDAEQCLARLIAMTHASIKTRSQQHLYVSCVFVKIGDWLFWDENLG